MAAADAAGIAASAIGGATPFGWAQLAMGGLGAAGAAAKPAGPSSADSVFGSSMFNADSSGWQVNIGSGTQGQTSGDRVGATQSPIQTNANPTSMAGTTPNTYSMPNTYPGVTPVGVQSGAVAAGGISPILLIVGALVLMKVMRK